ncbi:thymidylate synthase [Bacillus phage Chotacabras]|nr:thymidylate synthase [Bacillus phage Chotacabras]
MTNLINNVDPQYIELARRVKETGNKRGDRTGTGTLSVFGGEMRFNLQEGFPMLTTKFVPFRLVASEFLWFAKGMTDIKYLLENDNHIWDDDAYRFYLEQEVLNNYDFSMNKDEFLEYAKKHGFDLGNIYGAQWRNWNEEGIDQLNDVIQEIKSNPESRRLYISAWNPSTFGDIALPPCHVAFQFYVHDGKLSCKFMMRSSDVFLGLPFNIASYALATHVVAKMCDLEVGELIYSGGDIHLYLNHLKQIDEQISREPLPLPELHILKKHDRIEDYELDDFLLLDYKPHKAIKGKVSVGLKEETK